MKRWSRVWMVFQFMAFSQSAILSASDDPEGMLFLDIPSVVTASKSSQSLEEATSVMTVVSREDIERSGARTLYELLKRVPGFFPTRQATWSLSASRGVVSDGNEHVLLLVDGHAQNSIVGQGFQQQDMLPLLDKVEKIEIIRGPGSVVWGSSAVSGVINIITRDNLTGYNRNKASFAYGGADGMTSENYMYSLKEGSTVSGILSASTWKSSGYDRDGKTGAGGAFTKPDAMNMKSNIEFPWGEAGDWPALDQQREGYEMYAKLNVSDTKILGRIVQSNVTYPWDSWLGNTGSDMTMRKAYLEFQRHTKFGDKVGLDSILYGDTLLQNRFPRDTALFNSVSGGQMQDQSNEELSYGAEFTGRVEVTRNNELTLGVKGVRTKMGPNRDARFNPFLNVSASTSLPYIGVGSGYDNTLAGYFEDNWRLPTRTTFFAGGRYEHNDFREEKGVFLPRGGVIQGLSDSVTLKYVLNTGYLRPSAVYSETRGVIVDATRGPTQGIRIVDKSEKIMSHDVQAFWRRGKNYAAVTGFCMDIKNYISFDANPSDGQQGYRNFGDVRTTGVELEGKYHLWGHLEPYANYSYAQAKLDNGKYPLSLTTAEREILNYPAHIFNVGFDWLLNGTNSFNVNLNGWAYMHYVRALDTSDYSGHFDTLHGQHYVDVAYTSNALFKTPVDLTVFVDNVFDNTSAIGTAVNNGVWYPRGRNIGGRLSVRW